MQKLDTVLRVLGQIGNECPRQKPPPPARRSRQDFETARQNLQLCDARLASGDYAMASAYARRAMMPLRKLERAAWDAAMKGRDSPVAIPGTSSFTALPWYWALVDRIAAMHPGANRLPGGDFENLELDGPLRLAALRSSHAGHPDHRRPRCPRPHIPAAWASPHRPGRQSGTPAGR